MPAIGEFARLGRVSVRMLRHYDGIGLLRPAAVDPATGYRSYELGQLAELNRIVALKDLGFSLEQVRRLLADDLGPTELRTMLAVRQAELEAAVAETSARLRQVEVRLASLDEPVPDVVVKELAATRVVELSTMAAGFTPGEITPVVRPLCAELGARLAHADVVPVDRLTCYYELTGDEVMVHAAVAVAGRPTGSLNGLDLVDLPAVRVATVIHRGAMEEVLPSWQGLARWIAGNGLRSAGPAREYYLDCPEDPGAWITELQEPIA